jgi:predicted neuraminidase
MEIASRRFLDTPTRSVHAATIEIFNDHPVFAWFGGSREGAGDVAIYLHNLKDEGKTIIIGNTDNVPRWNPILFANNDRLFMFEKSGTFCDRWQTHLHDVTSWDEDTDERHVRTTEQVIPAGLNGPVKTRPVVNNGTIYCGAAVETHYDWTSYIEYYQIDPDGNWIDDGRSNPIHVKDKKVFVNPQSGRPQRTVGIIQPAIWLEDGGTWNTKHAFFRSSRGMGKIYYSRENEDTGLWTDPSPTNLPNPNSGVDVATYEGRLFLVSNPSETLRHPLVIQEIVRVSENSDTEWKVVDEIVVREGLEEQDLPRVEAGRRTGCVSGELSYPYMIENDGVLHLAYTYGRSKIEYVTISI